MGERPLAVCRAAVAACPGRVRVTESCPLQFTCAPEAPESSDGDSVDEGCATRITDLPAGVSIEAAAVAAQSSSADAPPMAVKVSI